jgi:predicted DCC family thiol-disulfide oxidoreductase YuxK
MRNKYAARVVLFDGDCRLCLAFARLVKALDMRDRIRIRSIQDSKDLLADIPGDDILDAMHVVAPDGRVSTGGDALPSILAALTSGPPLERLLSESPATTAAMHGLYAVLAEFRGHVTCRFGARSAFSAARSPR